MNTASSRYRSLPPLLVVALASCAPEETPAVGNAGAELTGRVQTSACSADVRVMVERAVESARYLAHSRSFAACVRSAMRGAVRLPTTGSDVGPYVPYAGDPFATAPIGTQVERVLHAARSANDMSITCTTDIVHNVAGRASIGTWRENRQTPEALALTHHILTLTAADSRRNATPADFYQPSRAAAAGTIWHEGMHQWGYSHGGGDWRPEFMRTAPYIVGACMSEVARASARCASCPAGQRPVARYAAAGCDCVDDPQYDVGVVLGAGYACPVLPGRDVAGQTELYMDDEDDDNHNDRGGWVGQIESTHNTRLRFCAVPGLRMRALAPRAGAAPASATYAVARMGVACPPGSTPIARYFDNEDDGNENATVGQVPPHRSDSSGTRVELCMFRGLTTGSAGPMPDYGVAYGVFAPATLPRALATGFVRTDDEDDDNHNALTGDAAGAESFLHAASSATTLLLARVR